MKNKNELTPLTASILDLWMYKAKLRNPRGRLSRSDAKVAMLFCDLALHKMRTAFSDAKVAIIPSIIGNDFIMNPRQRGHVVMVAEETHPILHRHYQFPDEAELTLESEELLNNVSKRFIHHPDGITEVIPIKMYIDKGRTEVPDLSPKFSWKHLFDQHHKAGEK